MKRIKKILICLAVILAICCIGFAIYVSDYARASDSALAVISDSSAGSEISISQSDDCLVFAPPHPVAGLIFYPGGKVEYTAYAPLMKALAERGLLCVVPKMPCNLAFMDMNAADDIYGQFPDVYDWYIGGHSLGGVAASSYVADHTDVFKGIILLASYSTTDLSATGMKAITIYGTEDKVLNDGDIENNLANLPPMNSVVEIQGGCHSYFGDYGIQDGDGSPAISMEEQIFKTVDAIMGFIKMR